MARNWESCSTSRLLGRFGELRRMLQTKHRLLRLRDQDRSSAIWRVLFARTRDRSRRQAVLARDFYATDLSVMRIVDRTMALCFLPPKASTACSSVCRGLSGYRRMCAS
jgi:hypothetical protein